VPHVRCLGRAFLPTFIRNISVTWSLSTVGSRNTDHFVHLLFISLTPYAASLIGHYEGDRIATIVFSANLGLASLSLNVLGQYELAREEWRTDETGRTWVKVP
jgi:hypothetical protein